ncbi:hypothetical protein CYR40_09500 [Chimaeribacter arupi]|uniref:hypothetical protein n=1 Tax=Chimaeribacter arupi TaxID=2060066 RepID=UPI000C795CBB|nr:hypothetical protein [Chimaeribacter arupi]PLR46919.1 hypothetical protein CYR40_09500 [Chimaeribacter arupi]
MKFSSKQIYYEYINFLMRVGYINDEIVLELMPLLSSDRMAEVDSLLEDLEQSFHSRQKDYLNNTFYKDLESGEIGGVLEESGQNYLYELLVKHHNKEIESLNQTIESQNVRLAKKRMDIQQLTDRAQLLEKAALRYKTLQESSETLVIENEELRKENKELKELSQQKRIDGKIPGYVKEVSAKLDLDDKSFARLANKWSVAGFTAASAAVFAAFYTFAEGTVLLANAKVYDEIALLYVFFRGVLGVGLLSWLANVCFSTSRNYTHESIRRKDRQHALNFGRLYLQIYGASAQKEEMLTVFKDWNMAGDSSFSKEGAAPPSMMEMIEGLNKMRAGLVNKAKAGGSGNGTTAPPPTIPPVP